MYGGHRTVRGGSTGVVQGIVQELYSESRGDENNRREGVERWEYMSGTVVEKELGSGSTIRIMWRSCKMV